jgi:tRNA (guanine-N7-)-methyltransferase
MRLRNDPKAKKELFNSPYLIKNFPYKISKNTIIELGMGKGKMITQFALLNPNKKYLGIEKYATVAHKAMKKANKNKLNNFYIICQDIKNINNLIRGKTKII